jgi:hypothetical protein
VCERLQGCQHACLHHVIVRKIFRCISGVVAKSAGIWSKRVERSSHPCACHVCGLLPLDLADFADFWY